MKKFLVLIILGMISSCARPAYRKPKEVKPPPKFDLAIEKPSLDKVLKSCTILKQWVNRRVCSAAVALGCTSLKGYKGKPVMITTSKIGCAYKDKAFSGAHWFLSVISRNSGKTMLLEEAAKFKTYCTKSDFRSKDFSKCPMKGNLTYRFFVIR